MHQCVGRGSHEHRLVRDQEQVDCVREWGGRVSRQVPTQGVHGRGRYSG